MYLSYLLYGLLQERIFNTLYLSSNGSEPRKFTAASAIGIAQFLLAYLATSLILSRQPASPKEFGMLEEMPLGVLNGWTIFCSNKALIYVSFPLQALFKSCKVLGVILVSLVNPYSKSLSRTKLKVGLVFTAGIFLFNFFGAPRKDTRESSLIGIALLLLSLMTDGSLSEIQVQFKKKVSNCSSILLYNLTSKWSLLTFSVISLLTGEVLVIYEFLVKREQFVWDLLLISIAGMVGQFFLFEIVQRFDSYVLPIVTSSRKIITVCLSMIVFGHEVTLAQLLGICLIFGVIIYELMEIR